jgi:hypothetical protein
MTDHLFTDDVWKSITSAAKKSRNPVYAAVAYFGQGASKLLPLPANSRLVVDASEGAVKSGQTCPADLRQLQKRGVVIYSAPRLHAKVYVFDRFVFIGSANVSARSAGTLIEAMLRITGRRVISAARRFVRSLCRDELSPGTIDRLQRIYRPPRVPGGGARSNRQINRKVSPTLPQLFLAQLKYIDPPAGSEVVEKEGLRIARSRRKHGRTYVFDVFFLTGHSSFHAGGKVVLVTEESRGRRLITPPADILYTRTWRRKNRRATFVYYEHPDLRRIKLDKLARRLGYGARKKLSRHGLLRDPVFAEKLLGYWSRF